MHSATSTDLNEALDACNQATRIAPEYAWAWNEQGITLETMGRYEDALEAYSNASKFAPKEVFYLYKQADVLTTFSRFDSSIRPIDQST